MASFSYDRLMTTALTFAALMLAGIAGYREFGRLPTSANAVRAIPPNKEKQWEQLSQFGHWIGDSSATVKIVEFADFECPYCARFQRAFKAVQDTFANNVALLVVQSPVPGHRFARPAALAAECAAKQGLYAAYHDALYEKQDSLGLKSWVSLAVQSGVADTVQFKACIDSGNSLSLIDASSAEARRRNVSGTPTVLINGWRYPEPPHDSLSSIVRSLIGTRGH